MSDREASYQIAAEMRALQAERDAIREELAWLAPLKAALREAVDVIEGRPRRSPFVVAVEDWKKLLTKIGRSQ